MKYSEAGELLKDHIDTENPIIPRVGEIVDSLPAPNQTSGGIVENVHYSYYGQYSSASDCRVVVIVWLK